MFVHERELIRGVQFKTAFRVYLCLMTRKEVSIKDVQRVMQFSTPAQARYHLRKLGEIGLAAESNHGSFKIIKRKFGVLRFFFEWRNRVLPISLFYAFLFALLTAFLYVRTQAPELLLLGALATLKETADTLSYMKML